MVTYADGHEHCFNPACGHHTRAGHVPEAKLKARPKHIGGIETQPITSAYRSITPDTFKRYGYTKGHFGAQAAEVHALTFYDQEGRPAHQKLRILPKDGFPQLALRDNAAPAIECQLWGMHVWGDQHDKRVVVTEGEFDAMSIAQASDFKYPVVSVPMGASSAAKALKNNYRWLDRFSEIILWLDNDDAGRAVIAECAGLFASGKVKLAKIEGFKDANDALQAKKKAEIELAIYGAVRWAPAGIVNAADAAGLLMADKAVPNWTFPFKLLNTLTDGTRRGEVYYHVAGTGIGKSSVINEFIVHWLFDQSHTEAPAKIGIMAFETLLRETQLGILSVKADRRLHLYPLPQEEMLKLHADVFGGRRVELFDPETAEWGFEALAGYMRYLAKACDCNILIIDPLSFVAAQLPDADERRALDKVAVILAKLSKELNVAIHIAHHLTRPEGNVGHEEGAKVSLKQLRGSGGIAMFANGVVAYERNQQAEGDAKLITTVRLLKWRWTGYTGIGCLTLYDEATGRTNEITPQVAAQIIKSGEAGGSEAIPPHDPETGEISEYA